ncbi:FecR/PupR family sigma factor regulator [Thalassotalea sp. PS06]|uniref:FecR/PupR family sigma factor regulator n=1 Tax=Thalassotalea sp. PS06 TaxID=2594005 RepID=UPI001163C30E|nr:DUF4880 domain-containing protein [Thalassotalea sp. PS06]QDP02651.1 DUF4880 domain-containing protein [Thalassotalea sp. PS06]
MSLEEWLAIGVPDKVADEAMQWIAKLDSGEMDQHEQEAFQAWLSADLTHLWAFEELSEFWAKSNFLDTQPGEQPLALDLVTNTLSAPQHPEQSRYGQYSCWAIAFIAIGFIASAF